MTVTGGVQIVVVVDAELRALSYLPDYRQTATGALERQEHGTRYILISRTAAADLEHRSEQLRAENEALLAARFNGNPSP